MPRFNRVSFLISLFVLGVAVPPLLACNESQAFERRRSRLFPRQTQNDIAGTIVVDGRQRTYLVHLPSGYSRQSDRAFPLVFALHGGTGSGRTTGGLTGFNAVSDRNDFIVAYPDGIEEFWASGIGTTPPERLGVDDVAFFSALIDKLAADYRVDRRRVYSCGISNGGAMSQRLACELGSKIAAVAAISSTMPEPLAMRCAPTRPIPIMYMHGTEDPLAPIEGRQSAVNGNLLSLAASVDKWLGVNRCSTPPTVTHLPDIANDGTRVRREDYGGCANPVVVYVIEGGGHTWPGGVQYLPVAVIGRTSRDINASEIIWEFFKQFQLPIGGSGDTEAPTLSAVGLSPTRVVRRRDARLTISWTVRDNIGVVSQEIRFAGDGRDFSTLVVANLPGDARSFVWTVPSSIERTLAGAVRVTARDAAGNVGSATSQVFVVR